MAALVTSGLERKRAALRRCSIDDVVDVAFVHRHPGVLAGADLGEDRLEVVVEIDAGDLLTRHHDVVDGDILQIEDRQQHRLVATWNHGAGFMYHRAQLVAGQVVGAAVDVADAQQPQQTVGNGIDQPHERVEQLEQRFEGHRRGVRDAFGLDGGEGLGRDLGEDQDHDGQRRRGDGRPGDIAEEVNGDDRGNRRREIVDEVVADEDDADEAVGATEQSQHALGRALAAIGLMRQAVAVDRHHPGFRTGEEGG